jgi:hypothetical protein
MWDNRPLLKKKKKKNRTLVEQNVKEKGISEIVSVHKKYRSALSVLNDKENRNHFPNWSKRDPHLFHSDGLLSKKFSHSVYPISLLIEILLAFVATFPFFRERRNIKIK